MATFIVPDLDEEPWPSLGGQVCDLIEERATFGPGSLKGKPAKLDDEKRGIIWKAYEVFPRGHVLAGRRRFKRVRLSLRKGSAKTELLGWVAFAELHPEAPVRFDGWDAAGNPVGRPVVDPYVPLLAYTKDQVEELAYNVLLYICQEGPDAGLFDAGLERIMRLDEWGRPDGKAVPLANSPDSNDGARTTFQGYDETHRLVLPRQVEAYNTMEANLPKRPLDDPWSMGTTTAGVPGEGSVAEIDRDEAEAIGRGEVEEPELFYFHRHAGETNAAGEPYDLTRFEDRLEAAREASGPAVAEWSDLRSIAKQWDRKGVDRAYLERVWLNRWKQGGARCFDMEAWRTLERQEEIPAGAAITVGLDGSRWRDTTGLVITDLATGLQQVAGLWIPTPATDADPDGTPVDTDEVEAAVDALEERYTLVRLYGDPAFDYSKVLASIAGRLGIKRVIEFYTDSRNLGRAARMCRSYAGAIRAGEVGHAGDARLTAHLGAAFKRNLNMVDDDGQPLWVMEKERKDSPNKIDLAMAGGLSWQARLDALRAGETPRKRDAFIYTGSSTRR